jgi:transcriptional regulator with XRE-family HTH domain
MTLKDYLKQNKESQHKFARRIGVSPSTITRYIKQAGALDQATIRKIFQGTGGLVTLEELVGLSPFRASADSGKLAAVVARVKQIFGGNGLETKS